MGVCDNTKWLFVLFSNKVMIFSGIAAIPLLKLSDAADRDHLQEKVIKYPFIGSNRFYISNGPNHVSI